MPRVKMPDGQVVDMPNQLTPELATRLKALQSSSVAAKPVDKPIEPPRGLLNRTADTLYGSGEAGLNLVTGAIAKPVSDVAGLAALGKELVAPTPGGGDPQGFVEDVRSRMTFEPRTPSGQAIAKYNPLALTGRGIDYIGGKVGQAAENVTAYSGLPPDVSSGIGRGVHEAFNQAPGILGAKFSSVREASLPSRQAAMDIVRGENLPKDTIRDLAQSRGIITPVEENNWVSRVLGATNINRIASESAADVGTRLIAKELGIPEGVAMTPDELASGRNAKGKVYDKVVEEGDKLKHTVEKPTAEGVVLSEEGIPLVPKSMKSEEVSGFKVDDQYKARMRELITPIAEKLESNPKTFSSLRESLGLLSENLDKDVIAPRIAVDAISQLRNDARAGINSEDNSIRANAKVSLGIADELESMIDRNLTQVGKSDLVTELQDARRHIAKSHQIEEVLMPDGKVDLRKLYNKSVGTGSTGAIKEMADYAGAFGRGVQRDPTPPNILSAGTIGKGLTLDSLSGAPINLGITGARWLAPYAAKKGWAQKKTPDYTVRPPIPQYVPAAINATTSSESNQ